MTSETPIFKTNEFLRRRKLRLQQVREQSKDIAKKIRQRAKDETVRQIIDLDAKKQKEYFDCQNKLVKHLEALHAKGLNNVGTSHNSASDVTLQEVLSKTDKSKLRGKEAAAALQKKRQQKLDEQTKLLDRKLRAREAANEISREKLAVANKLLAKSAESNICNDNNKEQKVSSTIDTVKEQNNNLETDKQSVLTIKANIGTQCDPETMPQEWDPPIVPALPLHIDDQDSSKDKTQDKKKQEGSKTEKSNKLDLFALSKEMPSDLRGTQGEVLATTDKIRPSLTLVSEYLQSRKLRLREKGTTNNIKRFPDDIPSLKQTILRTRTSNAEGRPVKQSAVVPTPILRSTSPFRRNKMSPRISTCTDNSKSESVQLKRKSSVMMYNHCTRDTRDMPQSDEQLVVRDPQTNVNAYAQAIKELSAVQDIDYEHQKKVIDMRNKDAVSKQAVEKEYRDTINFLNSLPKDKTGNVIRTAYMDERQQQLQKDNRQHKMQQEYKKIQKECRKHHTCMNKSRSKSKSPSKGDETADALNRKDYQYSWMPVPESDGNLAIHTIPNGEGKNSNSVKFSDVDSYHEYRSRHKHTPPTKDTTSHEKRSNKKRVKAVVIDNNDSSEKSTVSESSSVENLELKQDQKLKNSDKLDLDTSDAERIIIYKILDTKNNKYCKEKNKLLSDIAKSLTSIENVQKSVSEPSKKLQIQEDQSTAKTANDSVMFGHIDEGLYKVNEEKGDNMSAVYYHTVNNGLDAHADETNKSKCENKKLSADQEKNKGNLLQWQDGDDQQTTRTSKSCHCSTAPEGKDTNVEDQNSAATSTSSFKTATNDKTSSATTEGGYIMLLDENGKAAGKFFLGATNFPKGNSYEVVIQLRKKEQSTEENKKSKTEKANSFSAIEKSVNSQNNEKGLDVARNCEFREVLESKSYSDTESTRVSPRISKEPNTKQATRDKNTISLATGCQNDAGSESSMDIRLVKSCEKNRDVVDKGISPQNNLLATQLDPPSRPATTTYTQTTNSPVHRPVYLHMSSSTSTTYMSPPEIILPRILKHDFDLKDVETLDLRRKHSNGKCIRKLRHPGKSSHKRNMKIHSRENNKKQVSPNRATCLKHKYDYFNKLTSQNKILTSCKIAGHNEKKCKCESCGINIPSKDNFSMKCYKKHNIPAEAHRQVQKQFFQNFVSRNMTSRSKHKTTNQTHTKSNSADTLNPIIKNYVNKLLSLNRQGLKALEVAEQECSSATTPSSSIMNVPNNFNDKTSIENKISLEHIKKIFMQQVAELYLKKKVYNSSNKTEICNTNTKKISGKLGRKVLHKVKSLNISKNLLKNYNTEDHRTTDDNNKENASSNACGIHPRSRSSPTPRSSHSRRSASTYKEYDAEKLRSRINSPKINSPNNEVAEKIVSPELVTIKHKTKYPLHKATVTNTSLESTKESHNYVRNKTNTPNNMHVQTSQNIDDDFMKLAEDKLNNMEKIADLTEKCTKRLSSLARVLEEVRKNKSLVYNQISESDSADSQSEHKSDEVVQSPEPRGNGDVVNSLEIKNPERFHLEATRTELNLEDKKVTVNEKDKAHSEYISFLSDIPKPTMFQMTEPNGTTTLITTSSTELSKCRPKPPPALSRIHLKRGQEFIIPHELSTVLEVDSPMSAKNKNLSSRYDIPNTSHRSSTDSKETPKSNGNNEAIDDIKDTYNPDLLQGNKELAKHLKLPCKELSDDPKFKMIDLKHFNEIMLEPFITINEYAKKYNVPALEDGSNIDGLQKSDVINDDISSMRSDGSLPDVIAELLKRNIIAEPFKFETTSNMNSTTSESTLSMLALTKTRKSKKKMSAEIQNKENIEETTDTLSISSNADLENAFKNLGIGWASSTLKKTKERLALSSSSNTSSSSLSQFKIKSFNPDIPALVTDSISSVLLSKRELQTKKLGGENFRNANQQTSLTNSMTVKEFLTNELANKITFTSNKSGVNDTEEEFVSLFETKMPEGFKQHSQVNCDEHSNGSIPSGTNRARTSTPVQLFKSMTYQSSSCSNMSNGLFSNADLSSVKMTSNSMKNHSTSEKDDLTIPNCSLKIKKSSDCSKSE